MDRTSRRLNNQFAGFHRKFLREGLKYLVLLAVLVAFYGLMVAGLSILFYGVTTLSNPFIHGIAAFFLALLFFPIRQFLTNLLNVIFSRGFTGYEEKVSKFVNEIESVVDIQDIILSLRRSLQNDLSPLSLHVYYYDAVHEQYVASVNENGKVSSDLRFSAESPIVKMLLERQGPIFLSGTVYEKRVLHTDRARLSLIGARILQPLQGSDQLLGWASFGQRQGQASYQPQDLNYIAEICQAAARAIERAQIISDLEERVRHLNVLTRLSQGINITITRDDILELIYAQTTQLIPANDLSILVLDKATNKYMQIFCVQGDERLTANENIAVDIENQLEQVVIRNQKPFFSNQFERECIRAGVEPHSPNLSAWISVPLLSGAEIIGTLTIGRRDLDGVYTKSQVVLLEAIADQVAGALEKSRLLSETEKRAQQLSSLNEISRKLTSNLDFDSLLKNILQSAVHILQCEAGYLFLYDENEEKLALKVKVDPDVEGLEVVSSPWDNRFVYDVFDTREALRINEYDHDDPYNERGEETIDEQFRSALAVPLSLKDKAIGVIQIVSKFDRSPFTEEDEELLSAFAAQASISIENARLYTLTDKKLEARVRELSVLQRVGQELNATLDLSQAMHITLDWAMAQSTAKAGFIAILEEGRVNVIASSGYGQSLRLDENGFLLTASDYFSKLIMKGESQSISANEDDCVFISSDAQQQVFIPIERENTCVGLLLLETDEKAWIDDETILFLQRLIDHASISIANAQLYSAIQKANMAKSEFVSFVSHELKNPMTSIKGYTELLAAGAVGNVNEAQHNFLMTIRSNVDRMATLVSDLADESRIEAGRLRLDFESIAIRKILEDVIRSEGKLIEEKKLTLSVDIEEDLPQVWGDYTRLVQVMANLISNARKYTPEGSNIWVQAKTSPNHWDEEGVKEIVLVSVKDDGFGIQPEDQEKIFTKFFRSDDVKTREVPGTGLGLNISKSLIEAQGGKMWFESVYRSGTTFYFTIPIAENC